MCNTCGCKEAEEFGASSNYDFSQIDKILQDMDGDGSLQLTNTDGSQVRRIALIIYENIRSVQESIKQLREENAETFQSISYLRWLNNYLLRLKYDLDNELNNWAWVNMNAEAEEVPEGFHRMPDGTIMADSAHGAESFPSYKTENWLVCDKIIPYPPINPYTGHQGNNYHTDKAGNNFIHTENCWAIYTSLPSWEVNKQYWWEGDWKDFGAEEKNPYADFTVYSIGMGTRGSYAVKYNDIIEHRILLENPFDGLQNPLSRWMNRKKLKSGDYLTKDIAHRNPDEILFEDEFESLTDALDWIILQVNNGRGFNEFGGEYPYLNFGGQDWDVRFGAEEFGAEALVIPDGDSVPHHILYRLDREGIKYRFIEGDYGAEEFGAESFEATKGMDTYAQPLEELKIKPTKTKVGILLASIVAGGLWYSNKMKE